MADCHRWKQSERTQNNYFRIFLKLAHEIRVFASFPAWLIRVDFHDQGWGLWALSEPRAFDLELIVWQNICVFDLNQNFWCEYTECSNHITLLAFSRDQLIEFSDSKRVWPSFGVYQKQFLLPNALPFSFSIYPFGVRFISFVFY